MKKTNGFQKKEVDLLFFIHLIKINWKRVGTITGIITLLGTLYALFATPWYASEIKILPATNSQGIFFQQYANIAAMAGISLPNLNNNQEVYREIIYSNFILDKILSHCFKTEKFKKPVTLFEFWNTKIDSSEENWRIKLYEKAKNKLRKNYIHYSVNKKNNVGTLKVTVPEDPVLAAELANFIINQLDLYNKRYRKYKATEQRNFIENSLKETKTNLHIAEEKLRVFREKNKDISSPEKQLQFQRLQTEVEVQRTLYIELRKQLEIAKIEEIKEIETIDIIEPATIQMFKVKPKRVLIILTTIILGFFSSIIYLYLKYI